jgi:hypothetical protein
LNLPEKPVHGVAMRFAEVIDNGGQRVHVGVIMAAAQDWIEVSTPSTLNVAPAHGLRFPPSLLFHRIAVSWRTVDRVGLTYLAGGPPEEQFAGIPGLNDPRSLSHMIKIFAHKEA